MDPAFMVPENNKTSIAKHEKYDRSMISPDNLIPIRVIWTNPGMYQEDPERRSLLDCSVTSFFLSMNPWMIIFVPRTKARTEV